MKKFLSAILVGMMLFSFATCTKTDEPGTGETQGTGENANPEGGQAVTGVNGEK